MMTMAKDEYEHNECMSEFHNSVIRGDYDDENGLCVDCQHDPPKDCSCESCDSCKDCCECV